MMTDSPRMSRNIMDRVAPSARNTPISRRRSFATISDMRAISGRETRVATSAERSRIRVIPASWSVATRADEVRTLVPGTSSTMR